MELSHGVLFIAVVDKELEGMAPTLGVLNIVFEQSSFAMRI